MTVKEDKKRPVHGTRSPMSTSSSLENPLLDKNTVEESASIDTSHLTVDDITAQAGSALESDREKEAPAINTSHLSLEDGGESSNKSDNADDFDLKNSVMTGQAASNDIVPEANPAKIESNHSSLNAENPPTEKSSPDSEGTISAKGSSSENKNDNAQVMLSSDMPDEDFDKHIQSNSTNAGAIVNDLEDDDRTASDGPIKSILETVKKPEKIVRTAWSNSSARRYLIDNIDSYREKDEDQNMEDVIEKIYGGATEGKFSPLKFLKENILFSFLLSLLIFLIGWKAASIFFPNFMPEINDQIIDTVQKATSTKPAVNVPAKNKVIVTNEANKQLIETTLSHCLIEPDARTQFTTAFSNVGYEFSSRPLMLSYEEMTDSIKVWEGMNMDFYVKDAIFRFRELAGLALPVLEYARQQVSDYSRSLIQISEQAKELETRIRNIQTSGGNQTTDTINERLPLRNKLDELNFRLSDEPDQERFLQLLTRLAYIEKVLSGDEMPSRIKPEQITKNGPEWLIATANTTAGEIDAPIKEKVLPAIRLPAQKLEESLPKLTAFHLTELETAVENLLQLSSLIIYLPENMLIPYKLELSGLNRRLNRLMKKDLPEWMNYKQCLATQRAVALAAPN
jgi:hypothetical protein